MLNNLKKGTSKDLLQMDTLSLLQMILLLSLHRIQYKNQTFQLGWPSYHCSTNLNTLRISPLGGTGICMARIV